MNKKLSDTCFGRIKILAGDIVNNLQIKNSSGMDEKTFSEVQRIKKILYPEGLSLSTSTDKFYNTAALCILAQALHEDEVREKQKLVRSCIDAEKRIYSECQATLSIENK